MPGPGHGAQAKPCAEWLRIKLKIKCKEPGTEDNRHKGKDDKVGSHCSVLICNSSGHHKASSCFAFLIRRS